ncbi:MAG: MFS transporter [Candidatus Sumerlaeia bacterium]
MLVPRWIYFLVPAFFVECAAFMLALAQPIDALERFHANGFQLGLLGMLSNGGYAAMALVAGRLSDRTGRRPWMLAGLAAQIALALLMPVSNSFVFLLAVSALQLTLLGCFWAPFIGTLSDATTPAAMSAVLARFNISWCIGAMLGSTTNSVLYEMLGTRAPYLGAAAYFCVALAVLTLTRPASGQIAKPEQLEIHPRVGHYKILAWLALSSNFFVAGMLVYLFPYLAASGPTPLAPEFISGLHVFRLGAMLATFAAMGATRVWHFSPGPYHAAYGLLILMLLLTATVHHPLLLALPFVGVGVALGMAYALSIYYSTLEPEKGSNLGFHEALLALGATTGPIYGGVLMKLTGRPDVAFWLGALPLMAVWTIHIIIRRR